MPKEPEGSPACDPRPGPREPHGVPPRPPALTGTRSDPVASAALREDGVSSPCLWDQGVKVRATSEGPADDSHGTAAGDEATRVFVRAPVDPEETTRFVRAPGGPAGDEPTSVFVRSQGRSQPRTFARQRDLAGEPADTGGYGWGGREHSGAEPETTRTMRRPPRPRRRGLRAARIIALLLAAIITVPAVTWGWVWYTARQDQRPASDAIVVLGASQYDGRPSPVFEARLRHAADLYADGVAPTVVTVGGNQPGDNYTEGGSGARWLTEAGVPEERIVAIGEGSDTLESLELVSVAFNERGWRTAVIVSDPWHSLRSRVMAEDFGMEAATSPARSGPAVLERQTQLWYITRETASLWHYWIFGESATVRVDAL